MNRNLFLFVTAISLVAACKSSTDSSSTSGEPAITELQAELDACGACHKPSENDLSGLSKADLLNKLKAIRDGKVEHPSKLDQHTDARLEAIAAALASK
jgi:cytochrome c553